MCVCICVYNSYCYDNVHQFKIRAITFVSYQLIIFSVVIIDIGSSDLLLVGCFLWLI
jgi:hypothetical protein